MAYSRLLLLLLIEALSTYLPEVNARPIDFWCNKKDRLRIEEMIHEMDKTDCRLDVLHSPVQLPCVEINTEEWANKTFQQKHAEVLEAFQVFEDGVQHIRNQSSLQCQTSFLDELQHSITNYVNIVSEVHIQNDDQPSSYPLGQICDSKTSLHGVLKVYKRLLRGKLTRFAVDLNHIICKDQHRTINDKQEP
ncbi:uncharacterized protein FYW49_001364 [Xenentodon cancila]